jgi:hypothetical protein
VCRTVATGCAPWGEIARCLPAHCSSPVRGATPRGWTSPIAARPLFERGLELLGYDPFEQLSEGTRYQQPALFLCSVAAWEAWREEGDEEDEASAAAGHSLGEYAALVAAGALQFEDAVKLVDERASPMADAGEQRSGGMIAFLGGESRDVRALADRLGLVVANDNAPGQLVLSGAVDALEQAEEVARDETGARARRLDVTGRLPLAAHGAGRRPPARGARGHAGAPDADPRLLQRQRRAVYGRARELAENLLRPVRWRETLLALRTAGVERFVELGPAPCSRASSNERSRRRNRQSWRNGRTHHRPRHHPAPDAAPAPRDDGRHLRHRRRTARHVITNHDLEQRLDTSDEWIVRRTGIRERRHLRDDETLSDLASRACLLALDDAGRSGAEVDYVIVLDLHPRSRDAGHRARGRPRGRRRPRRGRRSQRRVRRIPLRTRPRRGARRVRPRSVVLVCGAEALSRVTDHDDRSTAVLFGDGAGAVVVAGGELELGRRRLRARRRRRAGRPALRRARRARAAHAGLRRLPPRRAAA